METRKLYYDDPHLWDFDAQVTDCRKTENGWEILLSATAFYPEGGGQACDLGILGEAQVLYVRECGDEILHLCDSPLNPGETVRGHIDGKRRFDLMQQHSGEHVVSGIIHAEYGYSNVGFHIGRDVMTIDFDGVISASDLPRIELLANQAVWKNLPLRCWYPSPEALSDIDYRAKRKLPWPVRIVEIPGVDKCACCGVHVAATGEIGIIKLLSVVKFHQGVRIEMLCGGRALSHIAAVYDQNRQVSQSFSAKILETGAAAQRINETLAAEKYRAAGLERRLFQTIADGYTGAGDVLHFETALSASGLRELSEKIAECCGGMAAVFSGEDGNYGFCLIGEAARVRAAGNAITAALNGRGGGKPGAFQGTVHAAKEDIRAFFGLPASSV